MELHRITPLSFVDFYGALIGKVQNIGFAPLAPSQKNKATYILFVSFFGFNGGLPTVPRHPKSGMSDWLML
jgi:hypothetical protein